jgi:putative aldouronate transport system substrate-binding protein
MKKNKKLMVTAMSMVMAFGLAACSEDSAKDSKGGDKDGKTTIRLVKKDDGPSNPAAVKYYDNLEKALKADENLDVDIELVEVPQGNYSEKLNLLLYSGDIPDLIYFQGGDQQIAEQDLLEDLTPYIKDSKYLKDLLQPYNEKRLENYPYLLWVKPLDSKTPVIRADWFNQVPSAQEFIANPTTDNYYKFFKELLAVPNGPKNGVSVAGDITELDYMFEMAFGLNQTWLKKDDGTYEYSKVSNKEKEKLAFYNQLYKDGILDPQYLTKQWDTKEKAFYDGETGVIVGTNGKVVDLYNGKMKQLNGDSAELVVLPPAKGEFQGFAPTDITKESRGMAISSQSENKEIAFKILDYLASPKGQMFDRLGFEGEHYNIVDNQIELTDKYYSEWYAGYWEATDLKTEQPLKTPLLSEPAVKSQELAKEFYSEDNNFMIPEEHVSKWDAMENLYKEYATDIITGKRPIDDFDTFVKEWEKAGGKELTEYANKTIK